MKTKSEYTFTPDWHVLNYSDSESENIQETDGMEEDREFLFFSFPVDDPDYLRVDIGA